MLQTQGEQAADGQALVDRINRWGDSCL